MINTLAYVFPPFRLLPSRRELVCGDAPITLGGRAFDLLVSLVERRDRTVGKNELMNLVWPTVVVEENNLQVQMVALRKLLGHPAIATVPGRGYRFTLPVQVEGDTAPVIPGAGEPADGLKTRRSNLPMLLPELIGRDDDVRTLLGLLERHALVTVAGAGGIGKTRLAQAVAAAQLDACPDGVWWVDLSAWTDQVRIDDAVAQVMAFGIQGSTDAASSLWAALPTQSALLVLDNAEHVLSSVGAFAVRVRREAPRMRLLVTSQEVLRVAEEQVFRLEPLALPDGDDPVSIESSAAVALFVTRAQGASRRFVLDDANRVVVADICRRLDGIPLAIELAAARAPLMGVQHLLDRLDQRLAMLTVGDRTAMRRHQTLRAALEWSHGLLSLPQQTVLRRLSVFAGGFMLDAAQLVAEDDVGIDRWDVLEHLGALVDKSLVMVEGDTMPRYRLLESTRLFALERLIESGEAPRVRERHRDHFLERAERARIQMCAGDQRGVLAGLDRERENMFLALAWAAGECDAGPGLRLVIALRYFWASRGMAVRGLEVTLRALARPGADAQVLDRCLALAAAAQLSQWCGDADEARRHIDDAVTLARRVGDARALCHVLGLSASIHLRRGEHDNATRCALEAMAIGGRLGDNFDLAVAMEQHAWLQGCRGDHEQARAGFLQALAMLERLDNRLGIAGAHLGLAGQANMRSQTAAAAPHLRQVLALLPSVDSRYVGLLLIGGTAAWAAGAGHLAHAARLEAAFLRLSRLAGLEGQPEGRHVRDIDRVRRDLGDAAWALAVDTGQSLDLDSAIEVARETLALASTA
jgi:predicted ATPase/DNA-binding winged helix-turn-helix (wHTH) protein